MSRLPTVMQNLPDAFLIDNEMTGDTSIIADKFNNLFANVGRRLSEQLTTPDNVNFKKLFTKSGSTKYLGMHGFTTIP